ncbi:hypothetical protein LTS17_001867 [Exophiala oligosperma]
MTGKSKSTVTSTCRPTTIGPPKARKVKTGCRTCKTRKVKCDESRPACRRCLQTGRVCDGYGIWGGGNKPVVPNHVTTEQQSNPDRDLWRSGEYVGKLGQFRPRYLAGDSADHARRYAGAPQIEADDQLSLMSMKGTALRLFPLHLLPTDQHGYMEWFMCRTAPKLPGAFKQIFWSDLLPQASQTEPAILHAVLSLGSIHKRAVCGLIPCSETSARDAASLFTLQQLTLATGSLRDRISNRSKASLRVAIIACAVFVQLEYLQDNYQTGLTHLRHGLILLEEFLAHDNDNRNGGNNLGDANDESIINLFVNLLIQARLLGQDVYRAQLLPLLIDKLDVPQREFQSSSHARRCLERIFLRIFSLVDETKCRIFAESLSDLASLLPLSRMTEIRQDLSLWLQSYERSMMRFRHTLSSLEFYAWKLLLLLHTLACLIAQDTSSSTTSRYESTVDVGATTQTPSTRHPTSPSSPVEESQENFPTSYSSAPTTSFLGSSHEHSLQTDSSSAADSAENGLLPINPCLSVVSQCAWLYHKVRDPVSDLHETHPLDVNETAASSVADIGWMPALYYTAILARDATTRQEAVRLLYLKPHREGIWESYLSAVLAEKIIEIKEQQKITTSSNSNSARNPGEIESPSSDSSCSRVRGILVELPSSSDAKVVLTYTTRIRERSIAGEESWSSGRCTYDLRKSCWTDECRSTN